MPHSSRQRRGSARSRAAISAVANVAASMSRTRCVRRWGGSVRRLMSIISLSAALSLMRGRLARDVVLLFFLLAMTDLPSESCLSVDGEEALLHQPSHQDDF